MVTGKLKKKKKRTDFADFPRPGENYPYAFSGGLSENECKYFNERDHKFYSSALVFAGTENFFFPTWKVVPGAYSDQRDTADTPGTPQKSVFFCPKEPERG